MRNSDPPRTNDSWRRLGLRLAVFCLPLALGWTALEWWAAELPNIYSVKRERLEAVSSGLETLITGSSSAYWGIQPRLLSSSAFNLAGFNQTLYEDDHLLTQVLPSLPKLKRVIIQIHYSTLFFRLAGAPEHWRQYCYQQEWGIPPLQIKDRLDCRMWSRVALRTPRYYLDLLTKAVWEKIRHGRFAVDQPEIDDMDDRGWCPAVHKKPVTSNLLNLAAAKDQRAIHTEMMKAAYEPYNIACLDHMLSILRQRGIEVDFVTTPVWPSYLTIQSAECWNETQRVVAQRTNNTNIHYYSFLTLPQLGPEDFYDIGHLSPSGSTYFTGLLNSALNRENPPAPTPAPTPSPSSAAGARF